MSYLWTYYGPSSTRISSISPPTIPDYSFTVGEAVSITLSKFCWGTSQTFVDLIGLDIDITSLPPGLTFNWATQRL